MPNAPHVHNVEEVVANIKRIEHNSSGPGSPSNKMAGPPTGAAGGSGGNLNSGKINGICPTEKGADWIGKVKD